MRHILAALLTLTAPPALASDACNSLLSEDLAATVTAAFPAFRLPLVTDNLAEDVAWSKEQTGNACLGVAQADFDGNGTKDWLLGLVEKKGAGALVVAALSRGGKWQLHELDSWPEGRSRLYVAVDKAGTYGSVLEGEPSEKGEVNHLVCSHAVAIFGATESSGVAYCYRHGTWQHTWISD